MRGMRCVLGAGGLFAFATRLCHKVGCYGVWIGIVIRQLFYYIYESGEGLPCPLQPWDKEWISVLLPGSIGMILSSAS